MRILRAILATSLMAFCLFAAGMAMFSESTSAHAEDAPSDKKTVASRIFKTDAGERVMVQDVWIDAPVDKVWKAFTTDEGWMAWASPAAKIDLRAGGTIRTHYTPGAKIGDPGTNVLNIINYVPERLLTLQAELEERWPEVMKKDAEHLMNVIVFESPKPNQTHVISYGVGYRDDPAYDELLKFFVPANEGLYQKLIDHLEDGKPAKPKSE